MNEKKYQILSIALAVGLIILLVSACGTGEQFEETKQAVNKVADPTERGLIWVAIAIVINGFIRGFLNK